jgi:phosphoribosyl 1,2-cyclic phosphate phosphodiesterase
MRVTILGCAGSLGVPVAGGAWGKCDPDEPRNRRLRPSILVESDRTTILVDTSPDLRQQLLTAEVRRIDAVLYTHAHADHVHGIDDLRPMVDWEGPPIPAHMDEAVQAELEVRFAYALTTLPINRGLYRPFLKPVRIDGPFVVGDIAVRSFLQDHGITNSLGFRFGDFSYSTDVVRLDDQALEALAGTRVWVVDATREQPHISHAHLAQTLEWIEQVRPERAYLTHMNHMMDYADLCARLPAHIRPCHDGLVIEI